MLSTRVISEAQAQLRTYGQLRASGLNRRGVERALADGLLRRVSRDSYVDAEYWRQTTSEIRHLIQMLAALARAEKPPVFSHHSAAILHRLPLFQFRDEPLHMTALQGPRVNSKGKIVRHIGRLEADDLIQIGPFLCTSLMRTAVDVARVASLEVGLGSMDAALRRDGKSMQRQRDWLRAAQQHVSKVKGMRGNAAARTVLARANGSAESVAESVSRLYLEDFGFDVATQVAVRSPYGGRPYRVDFELFGLGVFGEVDGVVKYTDPEMTRGKTANQLVIEEKQREDWIRGVTSYRMIRWGMPHLRTRGVFRDRLISFGIAIPVRRRPVSSLSTHPSLPSAPKDRGT
ncbi:hypothetical protein G7066_13835 [Leucobacter coleopterorum]|uniref:Transcriptional regulator, AbiEi antitoxin, Type IV TA system n=1 Tax=Leucobacter coleopterorum TaxID=2714933 RepID=A0ABX6K0K1_9MICO|nr:hypothetical protein [Leucobacter coleopterorum]QIM19388.1 hypothetical protein G7066_13835 [Leucobacter coleopterorum]